tara:strand:- start:284 stop:631 length:348 start_codon:yes stop_codon:yes gene_type:complete
MPRNPERIAYIIDMIEEIWEKHPDLRLGQLMVAMSGIGIPLFTVEDYVLIEHAMRIFKLYQTTPDNDKTFAQDKELPDYWLNDDDQKGMMMRIPMMAQPQVAEGEKKDDETRMVV